MICLTRLKGEKFYVNPHQIEYMEEVPETLITFLSGKTIYVRESIDEVIEKIIEYRKKIGLFKNEL